MFCDLLLMKKRTALVFFVLKMMMAFEVSAMIERGDSLPFPDQDISLYFYRRTTANSSSLQGFFISKLFHLSLSVSPVIPGYLLGPWRFLNPANDNCVSNGVSQHPDACTNPRTHAKNESRSRLVFQFYWHEQQTSFNITIIHTFFCSKVGEI